MTEHKRIMCPDCKTEFEYKITDIFTHWEFPYVLCPKCACVVLVKENLNEVYVKQMRLKAKNDNEVNG